MARKRPEMCDVSALRRHMRDGRRETIAPESKRQKLTDKPGPRYAPLAQAIAKARLVIFLVPYVCHMNLDGNYLS